MVEIDGTFSYRQHDWSNIREDPAEMTLTQRVLTYAPEKGMRIVNDATH